MAVMVVMVEGEERERDSAAQVMFAKDSYLQGRKNKKTKREEKKCKEGVSIAEEREKSPVIQIKRKRGKEEKRDREEL